VKRNRSRYNERFGPRKQTRRQIRAKTALRACTNGDTNATGINIENMNCHRSDGDDVMRSMNRHGISVTGQWLNRGWP
jgi:hypothetical protein